MAKVVFSPLVADVRGKLGPVVFQGGPGGAMLRAHYHRPARESFALQQARTDFSAASKLWETLTEQERALWASIARAYDPAKAGPGLAFSLGRRVFIRYASQYIHFGRTVPTAPLLWPFYDYGAWYLAWDPDSGNNFFLWNGPGGANVSFRIWLQEVPFYPRYSTRSPWLKAYDTLTDPAPFVYNTVWSLPPGPFEPFERYGQVSRWRAKVSGILNDGRVFFLDWGLADLVFP